MPKDYLTMIGMPLFVFLHDVSAKATHINMFYYLQSNAQIYDNSPYYLVDNQGGTGISTS